MQKVIAVVKDADGVEHRLSMWEGEGVLYNAPNSSDSAFTIHGDLANARRIPALPQNLGAVILLCDTISGRRYEIVRTAHSPSPWMDVDGDSFDDQGIQDWIQDWIQEGATVEVLHEGWVQP